MLKVHELTVKIRPNTSFYGLWLRSNKLLKKRKHFCSPPSIIHKIKKTLSTLVKLDSQASQNFKAIHSANNYQ